MNKFVDNAAKGMISTLSKVKNAKNTPKYMLIGGVTMIISAGVIACVKTLKLEEKVDDAKESIDHIKELREAGEYVIDTETDETAEYTDVLYRKDLFWVYGRTVVEVTKLYLPSLLLTGIGVGLIGGSNKILSDKLSQMTITATALSEAYNKYRRNVIADQGEEADRRYRLGLETKKNFEMTVVDEEGKLINKKEKKIDIISNVKNVASQYAVILDNCDVYTPSDIEYTVRALEAYMNIAQAKYDARKYIYLYEIWESIGALNCVSDEAIAMSHQVGLVKGYGDDDIKFDLVPTHLGSEDKFKSVLLLDINCMGPINHLVEERAWIEKGF